MLTHEGLHDEACMQQVADSILRTMMRGCLPVSPPIVGRPTVVIGSGFAPVLGRVIRSRGASASIVRMDDGTSSPLAICTLLDVLVHGRRSRWWSMFSDWLTERGVASTLKRIQQAGGIVLCPGASGCLVDPQDGAMVLAPQRDERSHLVWQQLSQDAMIQHLVDAVDALRLLNPDAAIVMTVSHEQGSEAHGAYAPAVGQCVMKSSLRTAVDTMMQERGRNIWYWPSYDIIRWSGGHLMRLMGGGQHHLDVGEQDLAEVAASLFVDAFITEPDVAIEPAMESAQLRRRFGISNS